VAAFYLRFAGSYRDALEIDQFRVDRLRAQYGPTDRRVLLAETNLTVNMRLLGDSRAARDIDARVLPLRQEQAGIDDPITLVAARNLAFDDLDLGRYTAALVQLRDVRPRLTGRREDDLVIADRIHAIVLRRLGQYAQALETAQETYRRCQDRFGPENHLTLAAVLTLANTLRAAGEPKSADDLATEALDRYRRLFGVTNPLTLAAATNHAIVLRTLGRWREARAVDERTFEETRRGLGADHPHTLLTAIGLATDLARHHDEARAVALGRDTLAALRRVRGDEHPETWACAANVALDTRNNEMHDDAVARLAALLGSDHPDVLAARAGTRLEWDIEPPPT
jgi:tetratricopeptide (TPR) repeat protein